MRSSGRCLASGWVPGQAANYRREVAAAFANNEGDFGHVLDKVFEDKLIERIEECLVG